MKPIIKVTPRSLQKGSVKASILNCVSGFNSTQYFQSLIGKTQSQQKKLVSDFQNALLKSLSNQVNSLKWEAEHRPSKLKRDSIDVFGADDEKGGLRVVIELDKYRADQIAKKFLSRSSLLIDEDVLYISLCYPGTSSMSSTECEKYFDYCANISNKIGHQYAAFIIE